MYKSINESIHVYVSKDEYKLCCRWTVKPKRMFQIIIFICRFAIKKLIRYKTHELG